MKLVVWGVFILLCIPFSWGYYADITITVEDTGLISVEGITNNPQLLVEDSPHYTYKNGAYWLLNFSDIQLYENLAYTIHLPEGASVNYMKVPSFSRIQENQGITISGAAQNTPLSLVVQYQLETSKEKHQWWVELIIGLIMLGVFLTYYIKHKKQKQTTYDTSTLSPRQAKIVTLLEQYKGELTQHRLEELTRYPKSSLSRNIASLERKQIVEKFNKGLTNSIRLRKEN